jgi:hypothetical protein
LSRGGKRYYITFIDDYSRYTRVYLLHSKDEAENIFIKFKTEVENQKERKLKDLGLIKEENIVHLYLKAFVRKMVLFMKLLHLVLPNKME